MCKQSEFVLFICRQYRRNQWQIYHRCPWFRWCSLTCEYHRKFLKISKWPYCYFQGLGGRWFMKKAEAKNLVTDTVPLRNHNGKMSWWELKNVNRKKIFPECELVGFLHQLVTHRIFPATTAGQFNCKRRRNVCIEAQAFFCRLNWLQPSLLTQLSQPSMVHLSTSFWLSFSPCTKKGPPRE